MKFLLLVILTFSNVYSEKLKVGISGSVPFRISEEGKVSGISLEIWEKIAEQEGFEYTIQEFSSVNSLVDAVSKNSVDIGIGPISVTSKRIELVSFTQPYYSSTKAFLVKKKDVSILFFLQNFFGETFIYAIGALLSLLFLFGNLLFLAERKTNPAFQHGYIKSVGNGIWLSIVTFSTVGYGDIIPRTRLGRLVIATWMITSMITASSLTAGIAASFTVTNLKNNPIDTLDKIRDKKIAAITGSTAVEVVKENKGKIIEVSSIKEGFLKVKVEESDAYLGDFPILKYNLQFDYFEGADILPISSEKDKYGFCLPRNSKHFFRINRTLLRMEEDETISLILQKWGI